MARPRQQIGLPALMAAITMLALWLNWADVVGRILERHAAGDDASEATPAVVFQPY